MKCILCAAQKYPIDYEQYVREVTAVFLDEMYQKYGLECEGSGGSMPRDVEEISVYLWTKTDATIEQARLLEVIATERFAEIINSHEKIRPFLREYPFSANRAHVAISFGDMNKKLKDNDVYFVFQAKNRIFYRAVNPQNRAVFKPLLDEPYEEAKKIVLEKKSSEL